MLATPHGKWVAALAALTAILWLVYLTVMLFEHRKVLKEMGVL